MSSDGPAPVDASPGAAQAPAPAVRVVSISLGSSRRDKSVEFELLGRHVVVERRGTDGNLERARELIAELDGQADAIGLGGTDLYVYAGDQRYVIRDAARLAAAAGQTPVLDGSGLKNTLEREALRRLDASGEVPIRGRRVLVVCGVDRYGMAATLAEMSGSIVFGDLVFNLGLPLPVRSWGLFRFLARLVLPLLVRLPFKLLYPTGEKQDAIVPKWGGYYAWADIVAGDFLLIRRHLPPPEGRPLAGKTIITNTTTAEDVALLAERGLDTLVTTTLVFDGRSFGTNVMEAVLCAIDGSGRPLPPEAMLARLDELGWAPVVRRLQSEFDTGEPSP